MEPSTTRPPPISMGSLQCDCTLHTALHLCSAAASAPRSLLLLPRLCGFAFPTDASTRCYGQYCTSKGVARELLVLARNQHIYICSDILGYATCACQSSPNSHVTHGRLFTIHLLKRLSTKTIGKSAQRLRHCDARHKQRSFLCRLFHR